MSVHHESMEMAKGTARPSAEAPELAYHAARADSLAMFGAAIGGAILGMLLTLLILAIINGGTLNFSGNEKLRAMQTNLDRINENVGAVSANVDAVAATAGMVQAELGAAQALLEEHGIQLAAVNESVTTLDETRQDFDTFVAALSGALSDMRGEEQAAAPDASLPEPATARMAELPSDAVAVLVFVDTNRNGAVDADETNLIGIEVALVDAGGRTLQSQMTTDAGVLFSDLVGGSYRVEIQDDLGYELLSEASAAVTVTGDDGSGTAVYIPVAGQTQ